MSGAREIRAKSFEVLLQLRLPSFGRSDRRNTVHVDPACATQLGHAFDDLGPLAFDAVGVHAEKLDQRNLGEAQLGAGDVVPRPPLHALHTRGGRADDNPQTPWQRVLDANILIDDQTAAVQARIHGINPADLTRQINEIQIRLTNIAQAKTEALAAGKPLDLESLQPSINRLTPKKRKPSHAHKL